MNNMCFRNQIIKKRNFFFLEDVVSNTAISCFAGLQCLSQSRDWYDAGLPGLEPDVVVLHCIDPRVGTPERNYAPLHPSFML
jgi:hypothetical protein